MRKNLTFVFVLLFICSAVGSDLEDGFKNPPEETKPEMEDRK